MWRILKILSSVLIVWFLLIYSQIEANETSDTSIDEFTDFEKSNIPLIIPDAEQNNFSSFGRPVLTKCLTSNYWCDSTPDCAQIGSCCFDYLNSSWPLIMDHTSYFRCEKSITWANNMIKETRNAAIVKLCPLSTSMEIKNLCESKDNELLPENYDYVIDLSTAYIFRNKYCALCHNVTDYTTLIDTRQCNATVNNMMKNPNQFNLTLSERTYLYNTVCNLSITRDVLSFTFPEMTYEKIKELWGRTKICNMNSNNDYPFKFESDKQLAPVSYENETFLLQWLCRASQVSFCVDEVGFWVKNFFCANLYHFDCDDCLPIDDLEQELTSISDVEQELISFSMIIDFNKNLEVKTPTKTVTFDEEPVSTTNVQNCSLSFPETINQTSLCFWGACSNGFQFDFDLQKCIDPKNVLDIKIALLNATIDFTILDDFHDCCQKIFKDENVMFCDEIKYLNETNNFRFASNLSYYNIKCDKDSCDLRIKHSFYDKILHDKIFKSVHEALNKIKKEPSNYIFNIIIQNGSIPLINPENAYSEEIRSILNQTTLVLSILHFNQFPEDSSVNTLKKSVNLFPQCITLVYKIHVFEENNLDTNKIYEFIGRQEPPLTHLKISNNFIAEINCPDKIVTNSPAPSIYHQINKWVNNILIPVSAVALAITIYTYSTFKQLRTMPGISTLHLSWTLLLNYILFYSLTLLDRTRLGDTGCQIGAVINHYVALCVFTWSVCLSWTSQKAFNGTKSSGSNSISRRKVLRMCFAAYIPPSLVVSACVAVSLSGDNPIITYMNGDYCWLSSGYSVLIGMTVPAALLVVITVSLYVWTLVGFFRNLKDTSMVSDSNSQSHLFLLVMMKLGILLGIVWIMPIINLALRSDGFDVFSNFLIAGQGLLISCCFLGNGRVKNLYRDSISRRSKSWSSLKSTSSKRSNE